MFLPAKNEEIQRCSKACQQYQNKHNPKQQRHKFTVGQLIKYLNINNHFGHDNDGRCVVVLNLQVEQESQSLHHPNNGACQKQLVLPPVQQLPIDQSKPALRG